MAEGIQVAMVAANPHTLYCILYPITFSQDPKEFIQVLPTATTQHKTVCSGGGDDDTRRRKNSYDKYGCKNFENKIFYRPSLEKGSFYSSSTGANRLHTKSFRKGGKTRAKNIHIA